MGTVRKSEALIKFRLYFVSIISQTSPSTGQALVRGAEQVTKLLSETLTNDTTEAIKTRPNIGNKTDYNYVNYCNSLVCSYQS